MREEIYKLQQSASEQLAESKAAHQTVVQRLALEHEQEQAKQTASIAALQAQLHVAEKANCESESKMHELSQASSTVNDGTIDVHNLVVALP